MTSLPLLGRVQSLFKDDDRLPTLRRHCADGERRACDALDAELILRAEAGRREAMNELLNRHYTGLYRFVRRLSHNDQDAEDMVHTVFVTSTLERLPRLADLVRNAHEPFMYRAYLVRSARNRFLDNQKLAWHAWRQFVEDDQALARLYDLQERDAAAHDGGADHLATRRLLAALARLPPEQEEALSLRVCGYSFVEIADIQSVPIETARDRRKTAARKLKAWLKDVEWQR